jgi:hypothetical protein
VFYHRHGGGRDDCRGGGPDWRSRGGYDGPHGGSHGPDRRRR